MLKVFPSILSFGDRISNLSVTIWRLGIFLCRTTYHNLGTSDTIVYLSKQFITSTHLTDVHPTLITRHIEMMLQKFHLILHSPLVAEEHGWRACILEFFVFHYSIFIYRNTKSLFHLVRGL